MRLCKGEMICEKIIVLSLATCFLSSTTASAGVATCEDESERYRTETQWLLAGIKTASDSQASLVLGFLNRMYRNFG